MYLKKIHIKNYRNFLDFTMDFNEGLNVIIGANNSGKTGLLSAIKLLDMPSEISFDDFNKNNLVNYEKLYRDDAPSIVIEYYIAHRICESDTEDESIIKLLPFIEMNNFSKNKDEKDGKIYYNISAKIKAEYLLDSKYVSEYKNAYANEVNDLESYFTMLKRFVVNYYSWNYTNGISNTKTEQKKVIDIFDIRLIGAERTGEDVRKEIKREISIFTKEKDNISKFDSFKNETSKEVQTLLAPSIDKLALLFENEKNEIGLQKGNVSITSSVQADFSLENFYSTEVKDTKKGYTLPLNHNGLGYNNLINIYMLIKLTEIHQGKDFRILCLEEPEAHLHPAMQYKLFKYLRNLDASNSLKQQIFVTTHSSNITAVAGLDNMFMMAYNRNGEQSNCSQQSLLKQFTDEKGSKKKFEAKEHLTKFLDATRSDMLFSDKIILVEGIAEKLLLPLFMETLEIPYEDEHISIVEIGGKHFKYFVELFNGNAVNKKVLCITDRDFKWIEDEKLQSLSNYSSQLPTHITELKKQFKIDNFNVCTQLIGGRTFEDELFITNISNKNVAEKMFKKAISDTLNDFFLKYSFNLEEWITHIDEIDGRSIKTIQKFIDAYTNRIDTSEEKKEFYCNLIFSEIFLHYAEGKKGNVALELLTDKELFNEDGTSKIIVPEYIQEGLKWLLK